MARIEYPECGKIVNTHGCHGGVKAESWCDTPADLAALPTVYMKTAEDMTPYAVRRASVFRDRFVFLELAGIESMEQAEALRGRILYAKRDDLHLPEETLLVAELIGMPVTDAATHETIGIVRDVIHPGATDIYVVQTPRGEAMIPAVPAFIRAIGPKGVEITPIEGLLP